MATKRFEGTPISAPSRRKQHKQKTIRFIMAV